jgi:hypothetical protein
MAGDLYLITAAIDEINGHTLAIINVTQAH